ncbi:MAG: hypothetical protein B1H05_04710 [Candidatus Cloacimonas sp. 4484_140]|nr:MAG: hypothetical protein B1H05_04710 [Candidatus Cloacimonas sp. 4484_140]
MIAFRCLQCQVALQVPDDWMGRKGLCPCCQTRFVIPKKKPVFFARIFGNLPIATALPIIQKNANDLVVTTTSRSDNLHPNCREIKTECALISSLNENHKYPRYATQFVSSVQERNCDIIIGLDFGTSCTKVVIRSPYEHGGSAYPVPFYHVGNPGNPYLLPSVLWVDPNGNFSLTQVQGGSLYRDIKLNLVNNKPLYPIGKVSGHISPVPPDILAVGYIALVLQETRQWFLRTHIERYGMLKLTWGMNIGIPSYSYDDEILTKAYRKVAKVGWQLSIRPPLPSVQMAKKMLREIQGEHIGQNEATIEVIPEVIAEAIGYARSQRRNEGLHILVDVGASTVDMCSFLLRSDNGEDYYHILTADVQPLGTVSLYRMLIDVLHKDYPQVADSLWTKLNPLNPFYNVQFPEEESSQIALNDARKEHQDQYRKMFGRLVIDLKTKRDPNSPKWITGVPIFLCGGGKMMTEFKDYLSKSIVEIQSLYSRKGNLLLQSLPSLYELPNTITDGYRDRLAVAWGLSYPEHDIGEVERPSEISDIPPRRVIERKEEPWER